LTEKAEALHVPQHELVANALRIYLDHLEKAEYAQSFHEARSDANILSIAEEGMEDYLKQIDREAE
jgi:hypothetical protein